MAANPQISQEIARLIAASEMARSQLGSDLAAFRQRLDAPARVAQSLRSHPFAWLGGALGTGLAATLLFRRRAPQAAPRKSRGLRGLLFGMLTTAAQPLVKTWLTGQLQHFVATRLHPPSTPPAFSRNSDFPTRP